ncbi:hypothetical protein FG386_002315 [Cryptosporidium ryanae]|uniref:uncharacterized protein n=1 Tax=Cryptosporidium ryanae TaxID=515981 RepID=UPI00351A85F7|nr:hypothetical protein FG386_002315 [Cryptosporidium ryanae]
MLKEFFILNSRGDTIIMRDFREEDVGEERCLGRIQDLFYKKMKLNNNDEPSIIYYDEINYIYLRQNGLFFILSSEYDVSPTYVLELLYRIIKLTRDFCGVINEDSIRRNFILLYELIDEIIDYGYPQLVNTDQLKYCVYNETKILNNENYYRRNDIFTAEHILGITNTVSGGLSMLPIGLFPPNNSLSRVSVSNHINSNNSLSSNTLGSGPKTISSNASQRPINPVTTISNNTTESKVVAFLTNSVPVIERNNEVFVDVFERISVVLNSKSEVVRFNIEGGILMKSYLIGKPELNLEFSNDIVLKEENSLDSIDTKTQDNQVTYIDDFNFHECVDIDEFLKNKSITLKPPEGELIVMNYRISNGFFKVPFKIVTLIEPLNNEIKSSKYDVVIKLKVEIPESSFATNLKLICPVRKKTSVVTFETINPLIPIPQSSQFDEKNNIIVWKIKKIYSGSEVALKAKINFDSKIDLNRIKKEIGPLNLSFEIPMFNLSNIQIKHLKISDKFGQNNYRWVRYITQSNSYVCRLFDA